MSWITLSILAAFIWSSVNILDKLTLTKWPIPPILPVLVMGIVGLLGSIAIFVFHSVPLLPLPQLALAFLAGCCYFGTIYFYFYAVKGEEISKVIPLLYLTPLWIALIAHFFLNEHLQPKQYMGISLLIAGAILISVKTLAAPRLNKALVGVFLSCLCFSFNQIITKYLLQHNDVLTIFAYIRTSTFLLTVPFLLLNLKTFYYLYKEHGAKPLAAVACSQSLNLTGLFIFVSAVSIGYVTLANALVGIQPFFVLLFVFTLSHFYPHLLKEDFNKKIVLKKLAAIALTFSGVLLIQQ